MDLKEIEAVSGEASNHWYYQSKAWAVQKLLDKTPIHSILDVGSGSGFFSKYLLKNTDIQEAWCVDIGYPNDFDSRYQSKPIFFRKSIAKSKADLVLMMDVLEHVDDDLGLLKNYVDQAPPNTYFLLTVPAFQFLWSAHDEFLEHKRRYTLPQLKDLALKSGLSIQTEMYFFGLVFPLAVLTRFTQKYIFKGKAPISQLDSHAAWLNALLKVICRAELSFMGFNRLGGLSACVLARKLT
jgi:SAM-dependent methyltransferase